VSATDLWCDNCNRLISATAVVTDDDGQEHCPRCAEVLGAEPSADAGAAGEPDGKEEGPPKAPWHFKVLLVATVIYLIYRLIWFIFWLSHHA
jgi:hypothetical protein